MAQDCAASVSSWACGTCAPALECAVPGLLAGVLRGFVWRHDRPSAVWAVHQVERGPGGRARMYKSNGTVIKYSVARAVSCGRKHPQAAGGKRKRVRRRQLQYLGLYLAMQASCRKLGQRIRTLTEAKSGKPVPLWMKPADYAQGALNLDVYGPWGRRGGGEGGSQQQGGAEGPGGLIYCRSCQPSCIKCYEML